MYLLNFKSIQNKLIFSIIVFMVIPMTLMSYFSSKQTEQILKDKVVELTSNILDQLNDNFKNIIFNMIYASNVIAMDNDFINSLADLTDPSLNSYDRYIKQQKITDRLSGSFGMTLRYNCNASLVDGYGNLYSTWNAGEKNKKAEEFLNSDWYKKTMENTGNIVWIYPHENYIPEEQSSGRDFISLSRLIKGEKSYGNYGVLLLSLYIDEMEKALSSNLNTESEGLFIINETGQIILKTKYVENRGISDTVWCSDSFRGKSNGNFLCEFEGEKMQIVFKDLESVDLKSVYITPYDHMQKEVLALQNKNMVITLSILIVFALVSIFIAFTMTKPLKYLAKQMKRVSEGNLNIRVNVETKDEIGQLTQNFNSMLVGIKNLLERISEEEKQKKEAHLAALQAQINPHFLFNTLNAIKWTAYMNGVKNIGDMVAGLGRLFEIVIDKISEYIRISEEIEYLNNYIMLMGIRYNHQFDVVYQIDKDIMELYTLKFVLQPMVENAIIHGLEDMASEGRLTIAGGREGNNVVFRVGDNGKGIPGNRMDMILKEDKNSDKRRFSGIGISNVNERIKLNFGDEYGLSINSVENSGTTVTVVIPVLDEAGKGVAP